MTKKPSDSSGRSPFSRPKSGAEAGLTTFLMTAFDSMGELVLMRGSSGRVLHVNRPFLEAFGGDAGDWVGRWFSVAPPLKEDGSRRYEMLMRTRTGPLWIEWDERQMDGGIGVISVGRDITARREHHDNLEASQRAKNMFFAAVTHELRTPLAGALGVARLLEATPLQPDQADYVRSLAASAEHALEMIDDILDLSRLEAGKLNLRPEKLDVAELVREIIELAAPKAHEKGLEIGAVFGSGAPDRIIGDAARLKQILFNLIGNAVKFTDAGGVRLDIANAPCPDGKPRLSISVSDTGPGISETDQAALFEEFERGAAEREGNEAGAGLGLAMVRRLAEAMGSAMGLESELGQGSRFWVTFELPVERCADDKPLAGRELAVAVADETMRMVLVDQIEALGGHCFAIDNPNRLAAASGRELLIDWAWFDRVVEANAAHSWVLVTPAEKAQIAEGLPESIDGWFVKPLRRSTLVAQVTGRPESPVVAPVQRELVELDRLRVLVAEDDPVNALIARRTLERLGAEVDVVESGTAALKALEQMSFDAALLDQRMPGMGGPELARMARANGWDIPLIALTANSTEADRKVCLDAGMDEFLTKPVDPVILGDTLKRLCGKEKRSSLG